MTPELAVPERRALYSLIVGVRGRARNFDWREQTSRLVEMGLAKVDTDGRILATEAGRHWLRTLLAGGMAGPTPPRA